MSAVPRWLLDVAVEHRVDAGGVGADEDLLAGQLDPVRRLGADVQVAVLAEERRGGDLAAGELHLVEVVDLDDGEALVLEHQRHRRVGQVAARGAGHHDRADPAAQLQQGLQDDVVLVAVRDHHEVDVVRQIVQGVAVAGRAVGADERVAHDGGLAGSGAPDRRARSSGYGRRPRCAGPRRGWARRSACRGQPARLGVVQLERLAQVAQGGGAHAGLEQLVQARGAGTGCPAPGRPATGSRGVLRMNGRSIPVSKDSCTDWRDSW